jgi:hypothetical protein
MCCCNNIGMHLFSPYLVMLEEMVINWNRSSVSYRKLLAILICLDCTLISLHQYVLGIWIKTYIFERTWNEILKMQILAGYMIVLVLGKHGVIGHCGGTKFARLMFLSTCWFLIYYRYTSIYASTLLLRFHYKLFLYMGTHISAPCAHLHTCLWVLVHWFACLIVQL